jgi:hypothetical protein
MSLSRRARRAHPEHPFQAGRERTKGGFMKLSIRLFATVSFVVLSFAALSLAPTTFAQCTTPFASQPTPPGTDEVHIDDSLPAGASVTSGTLNWDTSQYATGSQSFYHSGAGTNTLRIDGMNQYLKIGSGKMVVYVLIDPCSTTSEIRLTYSSASRTAHVYWGSNLISGGVNFYRGALPSTGTWTRLEVPLSSPLNLAGHTLDWVQIETYGGRVWFDHLGTDGVGCTPSVASTPSIPSGATVWIDDDIPPGSYSNYGDWNTSQVASGTQSLVYPYFGQNVIGVVRVNDMSQATASGDNLIAYVMPTSCAVVKELKITWWAGSTSGAVYWGLSGLGGESSAVYMGSTIPTSDTWNRIEIPAATVGLDGATITSFRVEHWGGQVWVDYVGNQAP